MKTIKSRNENKKRVTDFVEKPLNLEGKGLIEKIKIIQRDADYSKVKIIDGNSYTYDFSDCKTFKEFFRDIYYGTMKINKEEQKQHQFDTVLNAFSKNSPGDQKYIAANKKLLDNVKNFYKGRKKLLKGLKIKYFQFTIMMKIADVKTMMRMILEIMMVSSILKSSRN